jgi:hypothetical protein
MPYGCDKPAVITIPRPLAVRLHVIIGQHGRTFVGEAQNALLGGRTCTSQVAPARDFDRSR